MASRSRDQVLTDGDRAAIRKLCEDLGDRSADDIGFVPVRNLLKAFQAELIVRPMLVEGMLGSIDPEPGSDQRQRWAVLVDSESNEITSEAVESESCDRPMNARVRNTVAHELAHSLAFRYSELGLRLSIAQGRKSGDQAFVKAIEAETEKASPLLLVPNKALVGLLAGRQAPVDATELVEFARLMGASRDVLISRLAGLPRGGNLNLRERPGLFRLGVGMGAWTNDGQAVLHEWPIFHNFERNLLPSFMALLVAGRRKTIPATEVCNDPEFALIGGSRLTAEWESQTGIEHSPAQESMEVRMTVEKTAPHPGKRFLYAVRGALIRPAPIVNKRTDRSV